MLPVEELLLRQRGKLLGFIQKRLPDPDLAEDVLQDSLLKALRAAGEIRDEERLLPWFYRILNHAIIDAYRKQAVETRYLSDYGRSEQLQAGSDEYDALCACLRALLPGLKPEYAELIERLELQPGDPALVAQQLNIQPNNLKVRRHRARQALKQSLEETCRTCAVHGCLDCTCQA